MTDRQEKIRSTKRAKKEKRAPFMTRRNKNTKHPLVINLINFMSGQKKNVETSQQL